MTHETRMNFLPYALAKVDNVTNKFGIRFKWFRGVIVEKGVVVNYFQCQVCAHIYTSRSSVYLHRCNSITASLRPHYPQYDIGLQEFITWACIHGIPVNALVDPLLDDALQRWGAKYSIPSEHKLRSYMIDYAEKLHSETLNRLRGRRCSILFDGATRVKRKFIGIIIFTRDALYYYGMIPTERERAVDYEVVLENCINEILKEKVRIVGFVADNCQTNVCVLDPTKPNSLPALTGVYVPDFSCLAHTVELALKDLVEKDHSIYNAICRDLTIVSQLTHIKGPTFTRWDSLYKFVKKVVEWKNKKSLTYTKPHTGRGRKPKPKPAIQLPDINWEELLKVTEIAWNLIQYLEGNFCTLDKVMDGLIHALQSLSILGTAFAKELVYTIRSRMFEKHRIDIPFLTYLCSMKGHSFYNMLNDVEKVVVYNTAVSGLRSYLLGTRKIPSYSDDSAKIYILEFQLHLNTPVTTQDVWNLWNIRNTPRSLFSNLAPIILDLLSIPASEATVERVFACSENVLTPQTSSMHDDLFQAEMIIKMTHILEAQSFLPGSTLAERMSAAESELLNTMEERRDNVFYLRNY